MSNEKVATSTTYSDIFSYQLNLAKDNRSVCLTGGKKYVFKITDSFGDGMDDGTNSGSYLLKNSCGDTFINGSWQFPYGGVNLPNPSNDSIIFIAEPYKPNLDREQSHKTIQ